MDMMAFPWLVSPGAAPETIRLLVQEVGDLPEAYLACLRAGNGGEVGLRVQPLNLCLDSAEAALDYWRSGAYTKQGVFVFGGNGGGELLAFDLKLSGVWPVITFDPIDPEGSTMLVANGFEELLALCEAS